MKDAHSVQILPAQPGTAIVYDDDEAKSLFLDLEPVIAWRFETYNNKAGEGFTTRCIPLTVNGDPGSNYIGIKNPDGSVTILELYTCCSLAEAQEHYYPSKSDVA